VAYSHALQCNVANVTMQQSEW